MSSSTARLLDPGFVRELSALARRLRVRARSGGPGDHVSKRRGGSAEFDEHRPYEPGDDPRRIDWLAFARSGEPVVKLFRREEDVVARLVVDTSASMGLGDPSKLEVARRLAAAVAFMALSRSERAELVAASGGRARASGAARGKGALASVLRQLDGLSPDGTTDLSRSIDAVLRASARPGLLVVLGDFLDAGPWLDALGRAATAGHDLALVHVATDDELAPPIEGDFTLEDAETGGTLDVTIDAAAIEAYEARLAALVADLRGFARRHGAVYVRVRTTEALEGAARRLVARAID